MRVHGFRGPLPPGKVGSGLVLQSVYPQQVAVTWWEAWLLLASGLALVGALIAGLVLSASAPGVDAPASAIAGYYRDHGAAVTLATSLVDGVTAVGLLVFSASLRSVFGRAEHWGTPLSGVLFAGGMAAAAIALVHGAFAQALAGSVGAIGDPGLVRALFRLGTGAAMLEVLPLALLVAAASVLVLHAHGRPRWLAWGGLVLAPVLALAGWSAVLPSPALTAVHGVAVAGLVSWVAAISFVMFRHAATWSVLLAAEPEPHGARRPR
jgi:hypothetical protein